VLMLSLVYFGTAAAGYGLGFWLPTIVKEFGVSDLQTGFITAVPYAVGVVAVVIWPLLSDRMRERKWNTALAFLVAAGGLSVRCPSPTTPASAITAPITPSVSSATGPSG
jgi:MFS transporter, ACS family, tartrate transporter